MRAHLGISEGHCRPPRECARRGDGIDERAPVKAVGKGTLTCLPVRYSNKFFSQGDSLPSVSAGQTSPPLNEGCVQVWVTSSTAGDSAGAEKRGCSQPCEPCVESVEPPCSCPALS